MSTHLQATTISERKISSLISRLRKYQRVQEPPATSLRKEPTSYLSLPLELRQQILTHTFDFNDLPTPSQTIQANEYQDPHKRKLEELDACVKNNRKIFLCLRKRYECLMWVMTLGSVDDVVREDVQYVGLQWLEEVNDILQKIKIGRNDVVFRCCWSVSGREGG